MEGTSRNRVIRVSGVRRIFPVFAANEKTADRSI